MPDDRRPAAVPSAPPAVPSALAASTPAPSATTPAPAASTPAPPAATPAPAVGTPAPAAGTAAPGMLRWMEELVNTRSIETGSDEIATPGLLASWLRDRRLLPAGVPVTSDEHDRVVRIREGLRELIAANNAGPATGGSAQGGSAQGGRAQGGRAQGGRAQGGRVQGGRVLRPDTGGSALANLAGLARRLPLVLDVDGSQPRLMPLSRGTADTVLASLLGAVAEAVASGTWDRLKICRNPECRWAYYDHSRNRSRAWCSMAVCGNRAKARAFRTRAADG
jgi:hypothetical protein